MRAYPDALLVFQSGQASVSDVLYSRASRRLVSGHAPTTFAAASSSHRYCPAGHGVEDRLVPAMMTEALQRLMPGSHMHLREGVNRVRLTVHGVLGALNVPASGIALPCGANVACFGTSLRSICCNWETKWTRHTAFATRALSTAYPA